MRLGIVGLPNVGKSTLFNALTGAGAEAANYPFSTVTPNTGIVPVPDARLDALADMYHPKKLTPATVEFVDIAGLPRGASRGEGLGNKFLSYIREADALVHVVRCFEDENVAFEGTDPARDIESINIELALADLELVTRRVERAQKLLKADKKHQAELDLFTALRDHLDAGGQARAFAVTPEQAELLDTCPLLSRKPVLYCANLGEAEFADRENHPYYRAVCEIAASEGAAAVSICAKWEAEISTLLPEEKAAFLEELGLGESSLDRLVQAGYGLLGLISFLTAGEPEVRAWTITEGLKAPQAAGKIHSDLQRGFIRAEVIHFDDLMRMGTLAAAKEQGLVRSEGKEYVMKDGEVVLFRFNV